MRSLGSSAVCSQRLSCRCLIRSKCSLPPPPLSPGGGEGGSRKVGWAKGKGKVSDFLMLAFELLELESRENVFFEYVD